jgi:uncharacterized membrane protein
MDEQNNQVPPSTPEPEVQKEEPQIIEEKQPETPITSSPNEDNGKLCAILAYLLIGIIWYFADDKMKNKELAKFHVKQSLVLLIISISLQIVGTILPVIGWFIILPLASLFTLIWAIIGIVYAASGEIKELPIIGGYAKKFNF